MTKKVSVFDQHRALLEGKLAGKVQTIEKAKSSLLEAFTLYQKGETEASKADERANAGAVHLYTAQIDGLVSKDEVSSVLGDIFGFKMKKDGKPSKTPDGKGEAIRKRIVRAVDTTLYIEGKIDAPSYLDGVEMSDITGIIAEMQDGKRSIFTVYDDLGKLKERETVHVALQPGRIAKIVEKLTEDGVKEYILKSPSLIAAYAALFEELTAMSKMELPKEAEEAIEDMDIQEMAA